LAPRALVSRIDRLVICASPKASCRSIADFAWEVAQVKTVRVPVRARVIVFRNPYRRLISAYLNKYVEHSKYREASLRRCPQARLDSFADFVDELERRGFRCVDKVHFHPQVRRYRWWNFDRVFDAEDLEPLRRYVNGLCGTDLSMPFRVRHDRSPELRDHQGMPPAEADVLAAASAPEMADRPPWSWSLAQLRPLLAAGQAPSYGRFYNPELAELARRIYRADFRFLDRALRSGLLDTALHQRLTRL
jgi:hypothetical protein